MLNNRTRHRKVLSTLWVLSATLLSSSCVYHDYHSPHINGVIANKGKVLAGVQVSLVSFNHQTQTTTTDAEGHFSLIPQGEWNIFIPIGPQDRMTRWSLVIEQSQMEIIGYQGSRFGGVFSGYSFSDRITLVCDLSLANTDHANSLNDTRDVCKASDSPTNA